MRNKNLGIWMVPVLILLGTSGIWLYRITRPPTELEKVLAIMEQYHLGEEEDWEDLEDEYRDYEDVMSGYMAVFFLEDRLGGRYGDIESPGLFSRTNYFISPDLPQKDYLLAQAKGLYKLEYLDEFEYHVLQEQVRLGRLQSLEAMLLWYDQYENFINLHASENDYGNFMYNLEKAGWLDQRGRKVLEQTLVADAYHFDPRYFFRYLNHCHALPVDAWSLKSPLAAEEAYRKVAAFDPLLEFQHFSIKALPNAIEGVPETVEVEIDFGNEILRDRFSLRRPVDNPMPNGGPDQGIAAVPEEAFRIFNMRLRSQGSPLFLAEMRPEWGLYGSFPPDSIYFVLREWPIVANFPYIDSWYEAQVPYRRMKKASVQRLVALVALGLEGDSLTAAEQDQLAHEIWLKSPQEFPEALASAPGWGLRFPSDPNWDKAALTTQLKQLEQLSRGEIPASEFRIFADYDEVPTGLLHRFNQSNFSEKNLQDQYTDPDLQWEYEIGPVVNVWLKEVLPEKELYVTTLANWDAFLVYGPKEMISGIEDDFGSKDYEKLYD